MVLPWTIPTSPSSGRRKTSPTWMHPPIPITPITDSAIPEFPGQAFCSFLSLPVTTLGVPHPCAARVGFRDSRVPWTSVLQFSFSPGHNPWGAPSLRSKGGIPRFPSSLDKRSAVFFLSRSQPLGCPILAQQGWDSAIPEFLGQAFCSFLSLPVTTLGVPHPCAARVGFRDSRVPWTSVLQFSFSPGHNPWGAPSLRSKGGIPRFPSSLDKRSAVFFLSRSQPLGCPILAQQGCDSAIPEFLGQAFCSFLSLPVTTLGVRHPCAARVGFRDSRVPWTSVLQFSFSPGHNPWGAPSLRSKGG